MPVSKTRLANERAREREVCSYYPLSWDIPDLTESLSARFDGPAETRHRLPPPGHVPRASPDPVLTAFAQLGALRLGAARSLISLIDSQSQLVLAEATGTLSLRSELTNDERNALWLGNCIIPRSCGLCECVVNSPDEGVVVINDLQLDDRTATRPFVEGTPRLRFYAAVPLRSSIGTIIGAYCVFDDLPRTGLDESQVTFLQDVADAVVLYLGTSKAHAFNRKAERMIRGLTSFVTGAADLQENTKLDEPSAPENPSTLSPLPSRTPAYSNDPAQGRRDASTPSSESQDTEQEDEAIALQNQILPPGAKRMFSRAANIMRESSNLEGVVFFDASMANSIPSEERPTTPSNDGSDTEASTVSFAAKEASSGSGSSSASTNPQATCKILGFADSGRTSRDGRSPRRDYLGLTELALRRLLIRHPHGKIFNIVRPRTDDVPVKRIRGKAKRSTTVEAIVDVAHTARSAAIIPLWDYERQRWFAGCLCWTSEPNRTLSYGSDLLYLRAFGHSIMAELSRIDAAAVDQAKTSFIESMSHELRSPLHGILGGTEYLQSMPLDAFQTSIVNSIAVCGRTLLDTVQNVLEYSKINEFTGPYSKGATSSNMRLRCSSMDAASTTPAVNLCQLTEETVEAVFAGQSYNILSSRSSKSDSGDEALEQPSPSSHAYEEPVRKSVRVILDLPVRPCWTFAIQAGTWRHILMNVFGNALRYTHEGFVRVALSTMDVSDSESKITLTVTDSGMGMSAKYLRDGLFTPFTQENAFSVGTGLGMSIVRRLVQSVGGVVSVESKQKVGTEVKICVTLSKRDSPAGDVEPDVRRLISNWKVAVVREHLSPEGGAEGIYYSSEWHFHDSLCATLENWFQIRITNMDHVGEDSSQLTIYPGPSFDSMFRGRSRQGVSVVVALDAFEAATLRADPRVTSGLIQIITQPCGPLKLAKVLERYLSRLDAQQNAPMRPDVPSVPADEPGNEIMIVDDNPLNLRLLSAFLSKQGFSHTSAVNGLEALNLFKANPQRWAAVLMDLSMPVMDGVTATREIRSWEMKLANAAVSPVAPDKGELLRESSSDSAETLRSERRRQSVASDDANVAAIAHPAIAVATALDNLWGPDHRDNRARQRDCPV
ncbi:sensor histidine kinase response [Neofusicoccum parvum]|uniref:Sensor histidine kinase response n=1 Tax=Neofusicoccum parvum TaxID=310453 RepID=A0ACB5S9R6_9PEZI|nr:sensor histidine kinase response [Neofusicoccum parvum]